MSKFRALQNQLPKTLTGDANKDLAALLQSFAAICRQADEVVSEIQRVSGVGVGSGGLDTWGSSYAALYAGRDATIAGEVTGGTSNNFYITQNGRYDGSNWKYIESAEATQYRQKNGAHSWNVAAAGTAGNTISWTTALSITSAGLPLAPTAAVGTNTVQIATTAFVQAAHGDKVVGPGSSVDNTLATFDGTTGKLIKNPGTIEHVGSVLGRTIDSGGLSIFGGLNAAGAGVEFYGPSEPTVPGEFFIRASTGSPIYLHGTPAGALTWNSKTVFTGSEGTWTPTLTFATPGDLSLSSTTATGIYLRIGDWIVLSWILVTTPTFTTASGALKVTGVPVAAGSAMSGYRGTAQWAGITFSAGGAYTTVSSIITAGDSFLQARATKDGAAGSYTVAAADVTSGSAVSFSGMIVYKA